MTLLILGALARCTDDRGFVHLSPDNHFFMVVMQSAYVDENGRELYPNFVDDQSDSGGSYDRDR